MDPLPPVVPLPRPSLRLIRRSSRASGARLRTRYAARHAAPGWSRCRRRSPGRRQRHHLADSIVTASTVPANGDVNPYGIAFVPRGVPSWSTLKPGDVVVSNFNAASNTQGTGTTIVKLSPGRTPAAFFQGSNLGLTTALAVLRSGFVLVGNVPAPDGKTVVPPGSLLVIGPQGNLVTQLSSAALLDGPWDMTVIDRGQRVTAFVSNVLNGTVSRIELAIGDNGVTMLPAARHRVGLRESNRSQCTRRRPDRPRLRPKQRRAVCRIHRRQRRVRDPERGVDESQRRRRTDDLLRRGTPARPARAGARAERPSRDRERRCGQRRPAAAERDRRIHGGRALHRANAGRHRAGAAFGLAFGHGSKGQLEFAAVDDNTNTATVWTLRSDNNNAQ